MSNRREAERWLAQAREDLAAARDSRTAGHYEWACFQAQQAAEKALKAVLFFRGLRAILSHSLVELLREIRRLDPGFAPLDEGCRFLDAVYIPTRYPNGLPGTQTPAEFYTATEADRCLSFADSILREATRSAEGSKSSPSA